MWFIAFTTLSIYQPIEQETSRAIAHRLGLNQGGLPVVKRIVQISLVGLVVLLAVLIIVSKQLNNQFFEGI